jgi:hypothetical protein
VGEQLLPSSSETGVMDRTNRFVLYGSVLGLLLVVVAANVIAYHRTEWPNGENLTVGSQPPSKMTGHPRFTAIWYAGQYGIVGGLLIGGVAGWFASRYLFRKSDASRLLPNTGTFAPAEWNAYFDGLDASAKCQSAARLCAAVVSHTGLQSNTVADAIRVIGEGASDSDVLCRVELLVGRSENEYDLLVGGHESRLSCQDADVEEAFIKARAASALMFALQGRYTDMAYEAVHAVDSEEEVLNHIRMLDDRNT